MSVTGALTVLYSAGERSWFTRGAFLICFALDPNRRVDKVSLTFWYREFIVSAAATLEQQACDALAMRTTP